MKLGCIESNSMYPTLIKGDQILIEKRSVSQLRCGDIIAFTSNRGRSSIPLIHRLICKTSTELTTMADSNNFADLSIPTLSLHGVITHIKRNGQWQPITNTAHHLLNKIIATLSKIICRLPYFEPLTWLRKQFCHLQRRST